ncbi:MAG TPA: OmpA family protein [Bacteroidia bacterium]|nr:OmpA family protein [Bacteroidia bacterium]
MKTSYYIILLLALCTTAYGRSHKADKLFERWEYSRAARLYEKEAVRHPDQDVHFKLGECYRQMNRYSQAKDAYDKVNAAGPYSNSEFYLHYGQVLRSTGNNEEARVAFEKYGQLNPGDSTAQFYIESMEIVQEDHKWDEPITVSNVQAINSETSDFAPVLYRDGIVFASSRKTPGHTLIYPWTGTNYLDLYYATKGSNGTDYTDVVPFGGKNINQKYHDGPATFSADGNTMYFSRVEKTLKGKDKKKYQVEQNKIYKSELKDGDWSEVTAFAYNSNEYSVANPVLSPDGSRLYFVSDMSGGYGETDIYYCDRNGEGWGSPVNMGPNVNTFNTEKFPSVDSAGNFYFASDGYQGFGGLDICVALNKDGKLQKAKPLKAPFNSSTDDLGIVFLEDGRTGYFSSNRVSGSTGDDDIYYFNLNHDDVDTNLVTSIYTIGYRPPMQPIASIVPTPRDSVMDITPAMVKAFYGSIYFDYNKSDLRSSAKDSLSRVATYMKENPGRRLILSGHCDIRGTDEYNMQLSVRRNDAAIRYLGALGIPKSRISATGYGFRKLVNHCDKGVECPEEEHQKNRRVEFRFE